MKPAPLDYVRPQSVEEAVVALAAAGPDAKIIAGGQSLMPMINFRMVRPSVLVDINRIPGLDRIEDLGARFHLGALVRHRMTASDSNIATHLPVLHETMKNVAHLTVRNRGTFCGSLCHADPAAEMPMMALLLNGIVHIASQAGNRSVPAREFLVSSLTTALTAGEMVTGIDIDKLKPGTGWGFEEFARRHGDYALASVAMTMERRDGRAHDVRVAVMGLGDTAARIAEVENCLEDRPVTDALIADAVMLLREKIEPNEDMNGSADYRRHLAGVLASRVLKAAWGRAAAGRAS